MSTDDVRHRVAMHQTALILGVGDGIDQAITRSFAESGTATLTVVNEEAHAWEMRQADTTVPHWHSTENRIDVSVVRRLVAFLAERGLQPDVVVAQIDTRLILARDRRLQRWLGRGERRASDALEDLFDSIEFAADSGAESVILVIRAGRDTSSVEYRRLGRLMEALAKRASGERGLRVNAILVGRHQVYVEAANAAAFLASARAARVSGALIPLDDGEWLRAGH